MTRNEQAQFVDDLMGSIRNEIISKIVSGAVPAEWGGCELRALIADKFTYSSYIELMGKKRMREFRNACIVNNL